MSSSTAHRTIYILRLSLLAREAPLLGSAEEPVTTTDDDGASYIKSYMGHCGSRQKGEDEDSHQAVAQNSIVEFLLGVVKS